MVIVISQFVEMSSNDRYHDGLVEMSSNDRYHDGLGIFRKISIKDHIKILPSTLNNFQCIKFEDFFHLKNNIYLWAAYTPRPINSSYTKKLNVDIIDAIEKDIILYKQKLRGCYDLWRLKCTHIL
jgi:hypothetical protein